LCCGNGNVRTIRGMPQCFYILIFVASIRCGFRQRPHETVSAYMRLIQLRLLHYFGQRRQSSSCLKAIAAAAAAVALPAVMSTMQLVALQSALQLLAPLLRQLALPLQTLTAAYCTIAVLHVTSQRAVTASGVAAAQSSNCL
jgi:hypothetical protein